MGTVLSIISCIEITACCIPKLINIITFSQGQINIALEVKPSPMLTRYTCLWLVGLSLKPRVGRKGLNSEKIIAVIHL